MAIFLYRLGRACYRLRWAVVALWLVVVVAVGGAAVAFSKPTVDSFSIPGLESTDALSTVEREFGAASGDDATARVVMEVPEGSEVTDPEQAGAISAVVQQLAGLPQVEAVSDPFDEAAPTVAPDLRAVYATVTYGVSPGDMTADAREQLLSTVAEADGGDGGLVAAVGGTAVEDSADIGGVAEGAGVLVAVVVLMVTFGTLVAAGLNLLTALVGVGLGAAGITAATAVTELQSTTSTLAIMLGLAVGIDYGLFLLSRLRQELVAGRELPEAVGVATGTAGSAVVTAGLTVVIALAGLSVVGIPFLTQMGLAAAATVAVAVLVALTLLPALAGFMGTRVLSRAQRRALAHHGEHARAHHRGFLAGWARTVTTHRVLSLLAVVVVLGLATVPLASLRTALADESSAAEGSNPRRAYDLVAEHFGEGVNGPLLVVVQPEGSTDVTTGATAVSEAIAGLDDVATALPPQPSPDGSAALVTVIPDSGPTTDATTDLVHDIRALDVEGASLAVTGQTAVDVDVSERLNQALPVYLLVVVGLALVLLVLVFRSVLVPLTAVLGFLLTVGASLGSTVAVFQWGWLRQLVNSETTGPILSLTPILVVGILFGLAMDYQIFLVSRMHEAHSRGEEARAAVVSGFRRAAPVVVAAATIMLSVFGGFVPEGNATIKPIAFALAVGVLADAFVVRMVAIPAVLALLGGSAWWLPRWLRWLPELDVEGREVERRLALAPAPVGAGAGAH